MTTPEVQASDFESPNRVPQVSTPQDGHDGGGSGPPQSPIPPNSPENATTGLHRQSSAGSNLSALISGDGLRLRRPSHTNTVTTFYEMEDIPSGEGGRPGAEPGLDPTVPDDKAPSHFANRKEQCEINIIDYSDQHINLVVTDNDGLAEALEVPRTEELPCRWISVNGLSLDVIKILGTKYSLHQLALEDLLNTRTRTKVDWYADHAFIVLTFQKLVRLHQHKGSDAKCSCLAGTSEADSEEVDEKFERYSRRKSGRNWWSWLKRKQKPDVLPRYLDRDGNGKMDEFINAHSGTSEESPIRPTRTLHRYEAAQIPEHTAWMERHSALTKEDLAVSVEQVAIFLTSDNTIISFFENSALDVEAPIFARLDSSETMLRRSCDASLLLQAIIDTIVDLAVHVRDAYNCARKELQIDAMTNPNIKTSRALHIFGEEVDMLQNLFKPIVHLVNSLRDHNAESPAAVNALSSPSDPPSFSPSPDRTAANLKPDRDSAPRAVRKLSDFRRITLKRADHATSVAITPLAHTYFGDVLDHCITIISSLEQMDASANNISTLIFNTVGAHTNNFMMILAVVTVFFAPLTFISGYFGMNFANGNGLDHPFAFFWIVAIPTLVGFMILVFGVMLWDNIRDGLARRGLKARWRLRPRRQRRP